MVFGLWFRRRVIWKLLTQDGERRLSQLYPASTGMDVLESK